MLSLANYSAPLPVKVRWRVRVLRALPSLILTGLGLLLFGHGAYLGAKAHLAQFLLSKAWTQSVQKGEFITPWSGLDAYPVAKLKFAAQNDAAIVLNTDSGQALAFGPGLVNPSPQDKTLVIAAHKNTHFKTLKTLKPKDLVTLDRLHHSTDYAVTGSEIIDTRKSGLDISSPPRLSAGKSAQKLILVTCYPFDNVSFNGPLRYVVYAEAITSS